MNALLKWRTALNYSQENMARLVGVPRSTYVKWEVESRAPTKIARSHIVLLRWLADNWPEVFQQIVRSRVGEDTKPQPSVVSAVPVREEDLAKYRGLK